MTEIGNVPNIGAREARRDAVDPTSSATDPKKSKPTQPQNSKWDTSTINPRQFVTKIRDLTDHYKYYGNVDIHPISIKQYLEKNDFIQAQKLDCRVSEYSQLLIETKAVLENMRIKASETANLKQKAIKIEIEKNPHINAHVLHSEELNETRIVINTGLLDALKERFGKLTSSHLAFVIGHELGHIIEGHYDELRKENYPTQNGKRIELDIKQKGEEYLRQRAFNRDQEKRVDEHALRWMAQIGYQLSAGLEVLDLLASLSKKPKGNQKIDLAYIAEKINATHPGSYLRLNEARGVVKEIENEGLINKDPQNTLHKEIELPKDLVLTPAQKILKELQAIIKDADPKSYPWEKISKLVEETKSSKETAQLVHWVPFFYRAACNAVPFESYGAYNQENRDIKNIYTATVSPKDSEIVYEKILNRHQDLIETELAGKDPTEIKFAKFIQGRAEFEGSNELVDEFLADFQKNPLHALELVNQYTLVGYDCKALDKDYIKICQSLYKDQNINVAQRGESFLRLLEEECIDFRAGIVKLLLQEGLLNKIKDINQLTQFIITAEKLFGEVNLWDDAGIEKDLSYAVADWLKKHCTSKTGEFNFEVHQNVIDQIAARRSPIAREANQADWIYVKAAALRFEAPELNVQKQVDWIIARPNLNSGVTRDMLLFQLLEQATGAARFEINLPKTDTYDADIKELIDRPDLDAIVHLRDNLKEQRNVLGDKMLEPGPLVTPYLNLSWIEGRSYLNTHKKVTTEDPSCKEKSNLPDVLVPKKYAHIRSKTFVSFLESVIIDTEFNKFAAEIYAEFYLGKLFSSQKKQIDFIENNPALKKNVAALILLKVLTVALYEFKSPAKLSVTDLNKLISHLRQIDIDRGVPFYYFQLTESSSNGLLIDDPIYANDNGLIKDHLYIKCLGELADVMACHFIYKDRVDSPEYDKDTFPNFEDFESIYPSIKATFAKIKLNALDTLVNNFELGGGSRFAEKLQEIKEIYTNYKSFLKFIDQSAQRQKDEKEQDKQDTVRLETLSIQEACTICSDLYFNIYFVETWPEKYAAMSPQEKIDEINALYILPSEIRDTRISQAIESVIDDPNFLSSELAQRAYDLIRSPLLKNDLGRKIYAAKFSAELHLKNFDAHLALILATHPEGMSRESKLKEFFDGKSGVKAQVKTWQERDTTVAEINKNQKASTKQDDLIRETILGLIREAMHDQRLGVGSREKVDIVLWMAGIKGKPHLVRCIELVENKNLDDFSKDSGKLTDNEKQQLLKDILAGPGGILTDDNQESKRHFYDGLFYSVFTGKNQADKIPEKDLKYLKAVFDTLLLHESPDRAAEFLARFLVSKFENKSFGDQVKILFEARGFVGIKIAQYLVSNTTLLPDSIKKPLEDLTSRVQGPDKRIVFDMLERIHGPQIRDFVVEVGDRIGGGSLMSFYDVTVKNQDGTLKKGVIGLLRPDIIGAMPADLTQVYKAIETMQACPQIFGGKVVGMDMMETLLWQSVNETNLSRTRILQNAMRKDIQEFMKSHPGSLSLDMPEVWLEGKVGDNTFDLNKGPLIFMDKAQGQTLDKFMQSASTDETKQVKTQIAALALEQILKFGLVHTDLHQGNIMVFKDEHGKLKVSILDVGLSTELPKELQDSLKKLIQLFSANITDKEQGLFEKFFAKFSSSSIDPQKAQEVSLQIIETFELLGGHSWDLELKNTACKKIVATLSEKDIALSAKITKVMDVTRDLNLVFPREFFAVLRSLGIMDYIWKDVDRKDLENSLKTLLTSKAPSENLKKFDAAKLTEQVYKIAQELDIKISKKSIRAVFDSANKQEQALERFKVIYQGFRKLVLEDKKTISPQVAKQLIEKVLTNEQLKTELSIDKVQATLQKFQEDSENARKELYDSSFFKAEPLGLDQARQIALDNKLGMLPLVFKAPIYAGTPIRVKTSGNAQQIYISVAANMLAFEHPEHLHIIELEEIPADKTNFINVFKKSFDSRNNETKTSPSLEGEESVFSEDVTLKILVATQSQWIDKTLQNLLEDPNIISIEIPIKDASGNWVWVDFFSQACFGSGEKELEYLERTRS